MSVQINSWSLPLVTRIMVWPTVWPGAVTAVTPGAISAPSLKVCTRLPSMYGLKTARPPSNSSLKNGFPSGDFHVAFHPPSEFVAINVHGRVRIRDLLVGCQQAIAMIRMNVRTTTASISAGFTPAVARAFGRCPATGPMPLE